MNHHGSIRAVKRVVMSKWSKNLQAWLETTCSPKKNAKLGGDNHKYKQNLPIKTLGNPFISIKTRNLQKGDADAMGCSTNWLPGLFFAKSMCFLPCFLLVIKIQSFWPPLTPLESTVRIRFFVADFAAQRVNFFNQRVQQLLTMLVAKKHEMVVDFFVGSSFYHIFSTMVDMLHLHQEGGRDSDRWYIYIYIWFSFMDWVVYYLFDTSEWPVLLISSWARKAQRLQRVQDPWSLWGMRHWVHPQMFTTERDLHTSTHKAVEDSKARAFSIQRTLALLDVQRTVFYRFSHAAAIPEPVTAPAPDSATTKNLLLLKPIKFISW